MKLLVPFFGVAALIALFLTLPEMSKIGCKSCSSATPYLSLFGAGYFAALIAVSLLFPSFPGRQMARGGLIWAILLSVVLTIMKFPALCTACLVAHVCHIAMWTIWVFAPTENKAPASSFAERLFLTIFAPISVVALFGCLNLTFMAYGLKPKQNAVSSTLKLGDPIPAFTAQTSSGRQISPKGMVLNFIAPNCPFCKEQLQVLNAVAAQQSYEWVNITPTLPAEWAKDAPAAEWVEDKEGTLRKLFQVHGYPTLFVLGNDGKIARVILGVPEQMGPYLLTQLTKSPSVQ